PGERALRTMRSLLLFDRAHRQLPVLLFALDHDLRRVVLFEVFLGFGGAVVVELVFGLAGDQLEAGLGAAVLQAAALGVLGGGGLGVVLAHLFAAAGLVDEDALVLLALRAGGERAGEQAEDGDTGDQRFAHTV